MNLQYITDNQGIKQSVVIPFREWESLQEELNRLRKYLQFYDHIEKSFRQALSMEKGSIKQQTLTEFLDENS
ncbi:MAG: hypothetical protein MUE81_24300 [Thermoflexibacter sp.]|jgi:hypothetical protein|nr:hypothetical protein [Thermoflexibacter sp.]